MEFLVGGDIIVEVFGIGLDDGGGLERIINQLEELPDEGFVELVHLRGGKQQSVRRRRDEVW